MAKPLAQFIIALDAARKSLNAVQGLQLNSQQHRDQLRHLVEKYFSEVRPSFSIGREQDERVKSIDESLQQLLVQCHRRGSLKIYKKLVSVAREGLIAIDALTTSTAAIPRTLSTLDSIDTQIVATLQPMVPSAALAYQQAMVDLMADERLSWRGPATDLRECLRETLDYMAPDADIMAVPEYRQNSETAGPTMKQKVRFILKNRGASKAISSPAESAADAVEEALGSFVRSVYTRSNLSTHTPTDKREVQRVRDLVKVVLCELLEIRSTQ